jgi:hypothetical protein
MGHKPRTFTAKTDPHPTRKAVTAHAVGCFNINAGHALAWTQRLPGKLRIAHGSAPVAVSGAAQDITALAGDHFLNAEQSMQLKAVHAVVVVVLEALHPALSPDLVMDTKSFENISSRWFKPLSQSSWSIQHIARYADGLGARLLGAAQFARAAGQTHPHPFAAAALVCQS